MLTVYTGLALAVREAVCPYKEPFSKLYYKFTLVVISYSEPKLGDL